MLKSLTDTISLQPVAKNSNYVSVVDQTVENTVGVANLLLITQKQKINGHNFDSSAFWQLNTQ